MVWFRPFLVVASLWTGGVYAQPGTPVPPSPGFPPCDVCGGKGEAMRYPDMLLDIPDSNPVSCLNLQLSGIRGYIDPHFCPDIVPIADPCGCEAPPVASPPSARSSTTTAAAATATTAQATLAPVSVSPITPMPITAAPYYPTPSAVATRNPTTQDTTPGKVATKVSKMAEKRMKEKDGAKFKKKEKKEQSKTGKSKYKIARQSDVFLKVKDDDGGRRLRKQQRQQQRQRRRRQQLGVVKGSHTHTQGTIH